VRALVGKANGLSYEIEGLGVVHNDPICSLRQAARRAFFPGNFDKRYLSAEANFILPTCTTITLLHRTIERPEMRRVMITMPIVKCIIATRVCRPRLSYTHRACFRLPLSLLVPLGE